MRIAIALTAARDQVRRVGVAVTPFDQGVRTRIESRLVDKPTFPDRIQIRAQLLQRGPEDRLDVLIRCLRTE